MRKKGCQHKQRRILRAKLRLRCELPPIITVQYQCKRCRLLFWGHERVGV
jgi:hypothetical protein